MLQTMLRQCYINFTEPGKRFVLSLHYVGTNSFLSVNVVKIYQFKANDLEIKSYPLCVGNIQKLLHFIIWKKQDKK